MESEAPTVYPGFSFRVDFPLLIGFQAAFQEVSGISASMEGTPLAEGGENRYRHTLKSATRYDNLVLRRGMVNDLLAHQLGGGFGGPGFPSQPVLLTLLDPQTGLPRRAWTFFDAYPVRWESGPLNAEQSRVAMESIEFAYTHFRSVPLTPFPGSA